MWPCGEKRLYFYAATEHRLFAVHSGDGATGRLLADWTDRPLFLFVDTLLDHFGQQVSPMSVFVSVN